MEKCRGSMRSSQLKDSDGTSVVDRIRKETAWQEEH